MNTASLMDHWPEYAIEAAGLGIFMISAGAFGTLLEYPGSPVHRALEDPFSRRLIMGIAMGLTAIAIIYSPWGKRSGAHINPAVTLTFYRLGKIEAVDALGYTTAQFLGGLIGVILIGALIGAPFVGSPVRYVATLPGADGALVAFGAELLISFGLMLTILVATNAATLARWTGVLAGVLVAVYITFEAPFSGMSINPARTFASALPGREWTSLWVYFIAPAAGMLLAAEVYVRAREGTRVRCAKLHHDNDQRCIFRCGYSAEHARDSDDAQEGVA